MQAEGTPLAGTADSSLSNLCSRVPGPSPDAAVYGRLSAGGETMSDELQRGAPGRRHSISTARSADDGNPDSERDLALFARLGLRPMPLEHAARVDSASTVHADITVDTAADSRAA